MEASLFHVSLARMLTVKLEVPQNTIDDAVVEPLNGLLQNQNDNERAWIGSCNKTEELNSSDKGSPFSVPHLVVLCGGAFALASDADVDAAADEGHAGRHEADVCEPCVLESRL